MTTTYSEPVECTFTGDASARFCSSCGAPREAHGRTCPRCGTRQSIDLSSCTCGFPLTGAATPEPPGPVAVSAGLPASGMPLFVAAPTPANGSLILSLIIAGLIAGAVWLVSLGVLALLFFAGRGSGGTPNSAIVGFIVLGLVSLVACTLWQVQLTISQMRKRTGFTIGYGTEFWIIMVALLAELITSFISPLNLVVFVVVQWWFCHQRRFHRRNAVMSGQLNYNRVFTVSGERSVVLSNLVGSIQAAPAGYAVTTNWTTWVLVKQRQNNKQQWVLTGLLLLFFRFIFLLDRRAGVDARNGVRRAHPDQHADSHHRRDIAGDGRACREPAGHVGAPVRVSARGNTGRASTRGRDLATRAPRHQAGGWISRGQGRRRTDRSRGARPRHHGSRRLLPLCVSGLPTRPRARPLRSVRPPGVNVSHGALSSRNPIRRAGLGWSRVKARAAANCRWDRRRVRDRGILAIPRFQRLVAGSRSAGATSRRTARSDDTGLRDPRRIRRGKRHARRAHVHLGAGAGLETGT